MRTRSSMLLVAAATFALVTVGFNSTAMAQKVTGAIFTTDQDSNFVNANVYDTARATDSSKTAPYLNGGPRPNAPCSSAGLPDNTTEKPYYYFQVTDPSGKELLSSDQIRYRKVKVKDGLIFELIGDSTHDTGMGKCISLAAYRNNITVELFPFFRTPNPGGEYKVWMTKDYVPCPINDDPLNNSTSTTPCQGSFGFIPSLSKTDNFKISDYDGDGTPDAEDCFPEDETRAACDVTPTVSIALTSSGVIVESESATFTVTRTGDTGSSLTVFFTIDAASTASSDDYSLSPTGSVTFSVGSNTATITVTSLADFDTGEGTETVILTLIADTAYTPGSPSSATVNIDNFIPLE